MQQYDVPWMCFAYYAINNGLYSGVFPIQRVGIPLNNLIIQTIGYLKHSLVKVPVGQT
ncbi:hypothetical protein HK101_007384, partial [Irineochytrium annulatum]